jgi:RNA polymerase sigma-70 factor (ECF subfamily)
MDRIARCYLSGLLAVGRCACRDADNAPDAVQEALLAATARLAQFRGEGSVKAWISSMVVNACRCQERGRKNDPSWNLPWQASTSVSQNSPDPREAAMRRGSQREVAAALDALPPQDRELFLLSQLQDLSGPELAQMFEKHPDAIRAQLTRIRRKLRTELAEVWAGWREP